MSDDRLIVALDVPNALQGLAMAERLGDAVSFYKIGLGMLTGGGLSPSSSNEGIDTYILSVPNDTSLCGVELYAQAIHFGTPPFVLSNAQDVTVGY